MEIPYLNKQSRIGKSILNSDHGWDTIENFKFSFPLWEMLDEVVKSV